MKNLISLLVIVILSLPSQVEAQPVNNSTDFDVLYVSRYDTMDTRYNQFIGDYGLSKPEKLRVQVHFSEPEREQLRNLFFNSRMDKIPINFDPFVFNPDLSCFKHFGYAYTFFYGGKEKTLRFNESEQKQLNPDMTEIIDKIKRFNALFCSILYARDSVKQLTKSRFLAGDLLIEPVDFKPNNDSILPAVSFSTYLKYFKPFEALQGQEFEISGSMHDRYGAFLKTPQKYIESVNECNCVKSYTDSTKKNKTQLYNMSGYNYQNIYTAQDFYFTSIWKSCIQPTSVLDRYGRMLLITYSKTGKIIHKICAANEDIYNHFKYSVTLNPITITVCQASIPANTPYEGDSIAAVITKTRYNVNKRGRIISTLLSTQNGSLSLDTKGHYVINEK